MLSHIDKIKLRMEFMLVHHLVFTFPDILKISRHIYGLPRSQAAKAINICYQKLYNLENARIIDNFTISHQLLKKLSDFYDIPFHLLDDKLTDWVYENKRFKDPKHSRYKQKELSPKAKEIFKDIMSL